MADLPSGLKADSNEVAVEGLKAGANELLYETFTLVADAGKGDDTITQTREPAQTVTMLDYRAPRNTRATPGSPGICPTNIPGRRASARRTVASSQGPGSISRGRCALGSAAWPAGRRHEHRRPSEFEPESQFHLSLAASGRALDRSGPEHRSDRCLALGFRRIGQAGVLAVSVLSTAFFTS